jgi:hypothetical protein
MEIDNFKRLEFSQVMDLVIKILILDFHHFLILKNIIILVKIIINISINILEDMPSNLIYLKGLTTNLIK